MQRMYVNFAMVGVLGASLASVAETCNIPDFVWENGDPDKRLVESVPLSGLCPGMRADIEMWVDARDLTNGTPEASLAWDDLSGKKWAGSSGGTVLRWNRPGIERDAEGRRKFRICTRVLPFDSTNFRLYFFAAKPAVGRIRYSDIRMTAYERTYAIKMASSAYRDEAFDGDVRFAVSFITDPAKEPQDSLTGTFSFKGQDGKAVNVEASSLSSESAECEIPVSSLALGEQDVVFSLSLKNGRLLSSASLQFKRLDSPAKRRVMFDRFERTFVDGKPFFPLGMYWSENTLAKSGSLERYVRPGVFNALQTYEKAMTPEMLDAFHAKGLMVVASVKDIYAPDPKFFKECRFVPKTVKTEEDETQYVTDVVNRCKSHPALLAWYTCDEFSSRFSERLEKRYRLMKQLDPEHPVFVLAFTDNIRHFLGALDVGGTDPYPVCSQWPRHAKWMKARPDEGCVWEAGKTAVEERAAMFGLKPLWQVPQAFMWAWDHGGESKRPDLRFPTRLELSSMTWQQIAAGANGIFFYSYGQMLNNCRNEGELHKYFDEITVPVAREVKDMTHILLMEPGPKAEKVPNKTMVRTWRDTDGGVFVLVCNTHPERRKGIVRIEGDWRSAKPVFGGGVMFKNGALALDMSPIGVAIVKLYK